MIKTKNSTHFYKYKTAIDVGITTFMAVFGVKDIFL